MPGCLWLFLFATVPFWEARPPAQWTSAELATMLTDSPWAQAAIPRPLVRVLLATARPIEEAGEEIVRRDRANPATGGRPSTPPDIDYLEFIKEHRDDHFVLAIPYASVSDLTDAADLRRLEAESVMRVGRKKTKITGYFPPTPNDPVLRLIFPRTVTPSDKIVSFDLYLPGYTNPSRLVDFRVKDLMYHGKLEM
jgi:hypothetical protein